MGCFVYFAVVVIVNFVKAYVYCRIDDPKRGLYIWEEDTGWLHIAKLPMDENNIFFSIEEIEVVVGCKLKLLREYDVEIDTNEHNL